jgi:hypothetical protein
MEQAHNDEITGNYCYRVELFTGQRRMEMYHSTNSISIASIAALRYEYREWLYENNLPKMSAENLLHEENLSNEQRTYLKSFIVRWVSAPAD